MQREAISVANRPLSACCTEARVIFIGFYGALLLLALCIAGIWVGAKRVKDRRRMEDLADLVDRLDRRIAVLESGRLQAGETAFARSSPAASTLRAVGVAPVLGHEVEHIDLGHSAERIQTEAHLRHLGLVGDLIGIPVEVFQAEYRKDQELEADRYGTTLAVGAAYSPAGIFQLLAGFQRLEGAEAGLPPKPGVSCRGGRAAFPGNAAGLLCLPSACPPTIGTD